MLYLTDHARKRIFERGLSPELIEEVIAKGKRCVIPARSAVKYTLRIGSHKFSAILDLKSGMLITVYKKHRPGERRHI